MLWGSRLLKVIACLALACLTVFSMMVPAMMADTGSNAYRALEEDAYTIGVQAYIYGRAPVDMQKMEREYVSTPGPAHAPVNQFGHMRQLATSNETFLANPNVDTLYSMAWLELGKGPVVLHVPDTRGRYYVLQIMDAYMNNFAYVGRRTTGTGEGDFAIVGPGWEGSLPAGVKEIRSPTNTVWVLGRILVNGPGDVSNVTALQDQFKVTPLSGYGKPAAVIPPQELSDYRKYSPSPGVRDDLRFFEELRVALKNNPPPAGEAALMAMFGRIGLLDNETPYGSGLDPAVAAGLSRAMNSGDSIVKEAWTAFKGNNVNGWTVALNLGNYGYDYLTRAVVVEGGMAANDPEEAVYPKAPVDRDGNPLSGAHKYVMHFEKGNLPPVNAFWSLTMYNATTSSLVSNPIDRYAIGDRTQGLAYNADGSLDIYIQHDAPAGKESNWLPAPEGDFYLAIRMYQPKPAVLDGTYRIPPVQRVTP